MAEVRIYGAGASNYVRSVRVACIEKGISYELAEEGHNRPDLLKLPTHLALHPFGKIPAFAHGAKVLIETPAILRYIDEAFEGPSLQPTDVYERARMTAWMSVAVDYFYGSFMRGIVIPYAFAKDQPDRQVIDAGALAAASHAKILNEALEGRDWIAGDAISLADILIMPMLISAYNFPEGKAVLEANKNIGALYEHMAGRTSFIETTRQTRPQAAE